MKKILSILAVSVLMFSCSGFGGEKIESEDTKSLILQVMCFVRERWKISSRMPCMKRIMRAV